MNLVPFRRPPQRVEHDIAELSIGHKLTGLDAKLSRERILIALSKPRCRERLKIQFK